jgi:hypothetical protein
VADKIIEHLRQQNAKAIVLSKCKYRMPEKNLSCAAGCLISDDEYSPDIEGASWEFLTKEGIVPFVHKDLITDFQITHDSFDVKDWEYRFARVCRNHGVKYTPPTKTGAQNENKVLHDD